MALECSTDVSRLALKESKAITPDSLPDATNIGRFSLIKSLALFTCLVKSAVPKVPSREVVRLSREVFNA